MRFNNNFINETSFCFSHKCFTQKYCGILIKVNTCIAIVLVITYNVCNRQPSTNRPKTGGAAGSLALVFMIAANCKLVLFAKNGGMQPAHNVFQLYYAFISILKTVSMLYHMLFIYHLTWIINTLFKHSQIINVDNKIKTDRKYNKPKFYTKQKFLQEIYKSNIDCYHY